MGSGASKSKVSAEGHQVGINQPFPDGTVYEAYPDDVNVPIDELLTGQKVRLSEVLKAKKTIILGVPGAYTPNCT